MFQRDSTLPTVLLWKLGTNENSSVVYILRRESSHVSHLIAASNTESLTFNVQSFTAPLPRPRSLSLGQGDAITPRTHASRLETPRNRGTLNSHSSGTRWTRPQRRGRGRQQAHGLGLPYMRRVPQARGLQQRRGQRRHQSQGQRLQRALQLGLQ
jgi:hypothetical protein